MRLWRRRSDEDFRDEVQANIAIETDRFIAEGLTHEDARAAALRAFGNVTAAQERFYEWRRVVWLDDLKRDVSYAVRSLTRNPGFTTVAVLMLALGIGANTAIFTLVDAVLLKPLPVKDPHELVVLTNPTIGGAAGGLRQGERSHVSFDEFVALRDRTETFSSLMAAQAYTALSRASVNGQALEDVRTKMVSADYFTFLGVPAASGRTFAAADDRGPGTAPYAVMSDSYWRRRFGGSPSALDVRIKIGDAELDVIGVAPQGFFGESVGEAPDLWIPLVMQRQMQPGSNWLTNAPGNMQWLQAIGRLKPGSSLDQAQVNADVVFKQILTEQSTRLARPIPDLFNQYLKLHDASTGLSMLRARYTRPLYILMGVVALVLLIACGNVATLLLARAEARQREMGVRLAIGAGRFRIVRQLLTESLTLSVVGALLGSLFAVIGVRLLTVTILGDNASMLALRPDLRTLSFTLSVCILTAVVFGLAPAWRSARLNVGGTLEEGRRTGPWSSARIGTSKMLVVGQIALSVVLLLGAGWFVRSVRNLQTVDLGYPRQQLMVRVNFAQAGYEGERLPIAYNELRAHLTGVPGVGAVGYSNNGLLGDNYGPFLAVEGFTSQGSGDSLVKQFSVGPDYFSTLGIPLIRGRDIGPADVASAPLVCVVNEAFARFYFRDADPIGKRVTFARTDYTIVGVSRDVRDSVSYPRSFADNVRGDIPRSIYRPVLQSSLNGRYPAAMSYQIQARGNASDMIQAVRGEISAFNSAMTINNITTLDAFVETNLRQERILAQLATVFGALALLLASVGLSGVLSYAVARRTHEIGIRMALGAERGVVIRMILGETAVLIAIGLAIGVPASLASARLVRSQLFGLTPADPTTLVAALGIMIAVALIAGYLPARRASTIDPLVALRSE